MNNVKYPEHQEVETYVSRRLEYLDNLTKYGEVNHERMRQVYTMIYIMDGDDRIFRDKIREIGWDIHREGGLTAMQGCYYCLAVALRLTMSNNRRGNTQLMEDLLSVKLTLDSIWHGVGAWMK